VLDATRDLPARLDPPSHRDRMAHLAAWARTDPGRAAVCADLRAQGDYERRVALVASVIAQDHDARSGRPCWRSGPTGCPTGTALVMPR
jgi:hypothetical protein